MSAFTIHSEAACLADVQRELGATLERMIDIQCGQYPGHWSDADRRELAAQHLFAATPNVENDRG